MQNPHPIGNFTNKPLISVSMRQHVPRFPHQHYRLIDRSHYGCTGPGHSLHPVLLGIEIPVQNFSLRSKLVCFLGMYLLSGKSLIQQP